MTIGVDIRFLAEGKRTGVEEYALHLLHNLWRYDDKNEYRLFANYWRGSGKSLNQFGIYPNVSVHKYRYPNKLLNLSFWAFRSPQIDKLLNGCDVFFYPNIIFGATSKKCPVVTTFHDLSFELHPEFLSAKKKFWHHMINPQKLAHDSSRVIAVSNSTKLDLISRYDLPPGKIKVVHSGIAQPPADLDKKLSKVASKYNLPGKFVLFLATLEPRKNAIGTLRAFEYLKKSGKINHKLVIAGSPGWLETQVRNLVKKSEFRDDIHMTGFIEQDDKLAVFALADVFVFPSFYEGFGFPPLESMSVGTPVVTSTVSSLPEIVSKAAILVNPFNSNEIAFGLEEAITNTNLRKRLIRLGWERVQKFSWENTAQKTLAVLKEAAS